MFSSFFLGANSGGGFHSFYKELINTKTADSVYILKGGPGSGKSSIMRRVYEYAAKHDIPVERIFCSSDPDSLDAVILPTLRRAIVDGTAPHIVEPSFPLAVEEYINLGQFADTEAIRSKKSDIIKVKEAYSTSYDSVYRLCSCAKQLDDELFDIALGVIDTEYLKKRARGIISREIKQKGSGASERRRFTEAISPKGAISLLNNFSEPTKRTYVIEDSFGLSHFLLSEIKEALRASGHAFIACLSPLNPTQLVHLLIPDLSLAFVTSSRQFPINLDYQRKIRLDAKIETMLDKPARKNVRKLLRLKNEFIDMASTSLSKAKLIHDELEALYNPHIDFEKLYSFADELCEKVFE